MAQKTTTEAPIEAGEAEVQHINGIQIDDQGMAVEVSEPGEVEEAEAVEETTEPEEKAVEAENEPSSEDEQLEKFAKAKGLELDSENAKKAAKMAMNAEKQMHSKAAKANELERTMATMSDESATQVAQATGQDPEVLKRLQRMEVRDSIRDFWDDNPEARQYESQMADIAVNSGLFGTPDAILKASYAIARSSDSDALVSQGKKQALQSLAQKQQAAVPTGNAVNSGATSEKITPQNVDKLVSQHDQKWFEKHYEEINKAMAL